MTISITWSTEDVLSLDDTLTEAQAIEVLELAENKHDANIGINWDVLHEWISYVKDE